MLHLSDDEILAYRDGEERSAALARHLGTCPSCRQKVHAAERLARLLRVAKAEPLFAASISSSSVPAAIPESAALTLIRAAQEDFQSRIPQTEALGILIVRDAASKGLGISYRKTAIDEQFLVAGEETRSSPLGAVDGQNPSFDPSAAYKTAPGADTVEFENSSLHITARIVAGDRGLDLHIRVSNALSRSALGGLEMTLLRALSPPTTVFCDPDGTARLSVESGRSILLIYAAHPSHLGLEIVS